MRSGSGISVGRGKFHAGTVMLAPSAADYSTSTPMLRAVPRTDFMADSSVKQLRSGILILAISFTWSSVILPTLVLFGSADPFARLTARLISTGTGGVLVIKVKLRSE